MNYGILGPLQVVADGSEVRLGGTKQRALLAILLMRANEVVSRDVLIEELWGDRPPADTARALEQHISRLRKTLRTNGVEPLTTCPRGYELHVGPNELDLFRFERLLSQARLTPDPDGAAALYREALALWRGPPLEEIGYAPLAQPERARIEERRMLALEERIAADLACGRHDDLVGELESLVERHPFRERLRGQLMLALYRSGREADALSVYQEGRRRLVAELGIEPGNALRALEQAILRHASTLDPPRPTATARLTRPIARRRSTLAVVGVIGLLAAAGGGTLALLPHPAPRLPGISADAVGAIDPSSGRIIAETPVGKQPTALAAGAGGLWVANLGSRTVSRIDPRTRKVVDVFDAGGAPTALAAEGRYLWIANGFAGRVVRLDSRSGAITASFPLGGEPVALTVDRNAVWVANAVLDEVERIDRKTREVRHVPVGQNPTALAAGAGSIWVANTLDRTLTRIDSLSGEVRQRRISLRLAPAALALAGGSLWAAGGDSVARGDPATNESAVTLRLGGDIDALLVAQHHIWAADRLRGEIRVIDPAHRLLVRTFETGGGVVSLAAADREVWAVVPSS
jgi:DNA-binding SARP family transcriptional activator/DNA-binding beta-propeller fold protein YncE